MLEKYYVVITQHGNTVWAGKFRGNNMQVVARVVHKRCAKYINGYYRVYVSIW